MNRLERLRQLIQVDVGGRGLATDPKENLFTVCQEDLAAACRSLAETDNAVVGVVTGFFIPTATPPAGETDGPPGAVFLAQSLSALNMRVLLFLDPFDLDAVRAGLSVAGLSHTPVFVCPKDGNLAAVLPSDLSLTHLVALERPGPTREGRCRSMRGYDITEQMRPAYRFFTDFMREDPPEGRRPAPSALIPQHSPLHVRPVTIGIGDGGNEIGMGKISEQIIARNIQRGAEIACRVATDYLIVAGISNWGAYALAVGTALLRGYSLSSLLNPDKNEAILQAMVEAGPLVDGKLGRPALSVDGLDFENYWAPMRVMANLWNHRGMRDEG